MTENNRFILCNKTTDSNVWDTLEKQCYGWEYVVSLLNELHEENKELIKQREELFIRERDTKNELREIRKENKQLKQSYTKLKHRHSLLYDECIDAECDRDSYHKDVLSLEKENNQLKQENNELIKLINDLGNEEMDRQMEEILND